MNGKNWHCYGSATVGERGQVVIPAEARNELEIQPGDKLLVFNGPGGGVIFMKADALAEHLEKATKRLNTLREAVEEK
ncbi:MAG: AbrB/MazE/SpoVT family DNA-binding domain-containing protein [Actinobacteria bacterium]|nr:MAG: AbrB/MazE/SpoVT family DNA-binding domain-containing protein [Actinomycetota bacterium]